MSGNKLLDLSFEFAVAIVNLVDSVTAPKSSYMTDQVARAGTSVGANIHEAQYAQSKKDFIAKLEIALKESNETSYWLKLMYETKRIDLTTYQYTNKQTADRFLQNSKGKLAMKRVMVIGYPL